MSSSRKHRWWHDAIIYEIFPKSFCDGNKDGIGDIRGILSKLDYLAELGVNALWLCPVFGSDFMDSGYDINNFYKINRMFGDMEDFESLVEEAHKKNIKIILDITLNHTSDTHPWFKAACSSTDNPYRDYYIFREGKNGHEPNEWKSSKTLSSMWEYNKNTDDYYFHIYTRHQPDLNWDNGRLRNELYNVLRFWIDKGVDGFRLDVINKISKTEGLKKLHNSSGTIYADHLFENMEGIHDYLKEMRKEVFSTHDDVLVIGQASGISEQQAIDYTSEDRMELDLVLQFDYIDIDRGNDSKRKSWEVNQFKSLVMKWQELSKRGVWPTVFLGSHDTGRMIDRYGSSLKEFRVVSAKMLAALQLCLKGTQIIYMGDELGIVNSKRNSIDEFSDIRSKDIYYARIGRKEDSRIVLQDLNHFARDNARDMIPWDECKTQTNDNESVFSFYKLLLDIRKREKALQTGEIIPMSYENKNIFAYKRKHSDTVISVVANFSDKHVIIKNLHPENVILAANYEDLLQRVLKPYEVRVAKSECKI